MILIFPLENNRTRSTQCEFFGLLSEFDNIFALSCWAPKKISRKIPWSRVYDPQITSRGRGAHDHVTRCRVSRLVHSPGRLASVITRKISSRDPGITILVSQLTGLARLSYNRKVDFCCVKLRCRDLCKASLPGSCTQARSCIVRLVHHSARLVHRRTNIRSHSALFNYLLRSTKGCDNWKRAAYLQGSFFILENSYHQGDICLQNNEKWNITAAWLDQLGECRSCWAGGRGSNLGWTNTQGLWITEKKVLPL